MSIWDVALEAKAMFPDGKAWRGDPTRLATKCGVSKGQAYSAMRIAKIAVSGKGNPAIVTPLEAAVRERFPDIGRHVLLAEEFGVSRSRVSQIVRKVQRQTERQEQ